MALEQKLSLKMVQKLVMTPSLQQAIKLLQMTRLELRELLTQELVENPVLEEIMETVDAEPPQPTEEAKDERQVDGEELDHSESMENVDLAEYLGDYMDGPSYASTREERQGVPLENTLTRDPDLYDHLLWQLHMSDVSPRQRALAELIIGNLDPDGFLVASPEEIKALWLEDDEDGSCSLDEVEEALALVQSFDPPGIACRDLRESLLAQLKARGVSEDDLTYRVVDERWDLFVRRQFQVIGRQLGVALADLEEVIEEIRTLELRPGRKFSSDRPHYIEPDVTVVKVGDNYVIQLNDDGMPRLRVSRAYRRMLKEMRRTGRQAEAQQFIKDKMRSAVWLIKSLDQRQRTIYKVAESIVRQQRGFLDSGIDYLRPMVLRDVADDIGMHESTVSRVVSNKYIHTPRGLHPMKFFFHSGIDRDYGENISSLTVKQKIEELIQHEDAKRPLSDSELMRVLKRQGIQIARRTVAKYRDELGIPSSTDRKQIF